MSIQESGEDDQPPPQAVLKASPRMRPQALGRRSRSSPPCPGRGQPSAGMVDPYHGTCPLCGKAVLTYTSNRIPGARLLVEHDRPKPPASPPPEDPDALL